LKHSNDNIRNKRKSDSIELQTMDSEYRTKLLLAKEEISTLKFELNMAKKNNKRKRDDDQPKWTQVRFSKCINTHDGKAYHIHACEHCNDCSFECRVECANKWGLPRELKDVVDSEI